MARFKLNLTDTALHTHTDIGEGIMEVELLQWFVQPGDTIKQFDKVCEVQSDKATVEITSRYDGTVLTLHHSIGSMVQTGAPLVDIATAAGDPVRPLANAPPNDAASKLTIPSATSIQSGGISTAAASTTAATDILIPLAELFSGSSTADAAAVAAAELVLTTPAVRRIAREYGIQLGTPAHSSLTGSGPRGRVLKGDVVNYARANGLQPRALSSADTATAAGTATAAAASTTAAVTKGWGRLERAPLAATASTVTAAPVVKAAVPAAAAAAPAAAAAAAVGVPQPLWPPQQQQQQQSGSSVSSSSSSSSGAVAKQAGDAAAGDVIAVRGMQKAMMQQMRSALSVPHMTYCEEVHTTTYHCFVSLLV
jgi:pyruvate/2-oxoglutarate dehydrogenase complex dihydrolipoamide acyltransferase (E2) component